MAGVTAVRVLAGALLLGASFAAETRGQDRFSNGPDRPGRSGVIRVEGRNAFFVVDGERNLMSFHGQGVTIQDWCAGARDFDVFDRQFIEVPSGAIEALYLSADHHVWIYPAAPFDCAVLVGLPLLADGEARLVRVDNDLLGFGGPGANSFGWTSTGILTDPATGEPVHYTETVRALISPFAEPGPGDVDEILVAIRLR
jgi:hypothetical protein